jgi:hypothetical protein
MHVLIDARMMQRAMDEVDAEVRENQKQRELGEVVPSSRTICKGIVEFGIAPYLSEEEGRREGGDPGHSVDGLADFHTDLVFEEFGMLESCFVEDEEVGEGGDDEVDRCAGDPGDCGQLYCNNWNDG